MLPNTAAVVAVVAATSLVGCGFRNVKDAPVTLAGVRAAFVYSGSARHVAADGERLRKGDRVRTAPGGTVTLVVRERRVLVGERAEVGVVDGATVDLTQGALLVDHRRGPGITVQAGDTTVDDIGSGAVRIERTLSVAVAALSARARVRTMTGVRRSLAPLYQLGVAGRALPENAAPLQLRDDAWERDVVPTLVADDVRLNDLAAGLDTNGEHPSDRLLADAIGRAAGRDDTTRERATARAGQLRAQGGSWGVVAALVKTKAVDVGTALAIVLRGGDVPAAPGGSPSSSKSPDPAVAGPSPEPLPGGPSPSRTPAPSRSGSSGPSGSPSPSGSPTSESVVDQLGKLIPTPSVGVGLL